MKDMKLFIIGILEMQNKTICNCNYIWLNKFTVLGKIELRLKMVALTAYL